MKKIIVITTGGTIAMKYDKEVNGCAKFLESAIRYWVDRV